MAVAIGGSIPLVIDAEGDGVMTLNTITNALPVDGTITEENGIWSEGPCADMLSRPLERPSMTLHPRFTLFIANKDSARVVSWLGGISNS